MSLFHFLFTILIDSFDTLLRKFDILLCATIRMHHFSLQVAAFDVPDAFNLCWVVSSSRNPCLPKISQRWTRSSLRFPVAIDGFSWEKYFIKESTSHNPSPQDSINLFRKLLILFRRKWVPHSFQFFDWLIFCEEYFHPSFFSVSSAFFISSMNSFTWASEWIK